MLDSPFKGAFEFATAKKFDFRKSLTIIFLYVYSLMGTFAETEIVDYRSSLRKTHFLFPFPLCAIVRKTSFSVNSVFHFYCATKMKFKTLLKNNLYRNVHCFKSQISGSYLFNRFFLQGKSQTINKFKSELKYWAILKFHTKKSNRKRKTEALAIFLNLFAHRANKSLPFVRLLAK